MRIHNIRSGRPEPEIEILYAVYEDKKEPILAIDAVRVVEEHVDQDQAVLLLGHSLKIKAERKQRFGRLDWCRGGRYIEKSDILS